MKLFIVANHTPNSVEEWLRGEGVTVSNNLKKSIVTTLFYFDYLKLRKDLSILQDSIANIILFDGPIAHFKLNGSYALDLNYSMNKPHYGIKFVGLQTKVWNNAKPNIITNGKRYSHADSIISVIEKISILNRMMTEIYLLPLSMQKVAKVILLNHMFHKVHSDEILIEKLPSKIKEKNRLAFYDIIKSDLYRLYVEALNCKSDNVDDCAKHYGISAYDLRYILTVKVSKSDFLSLLS